MAAVFTMLVNEIGYWMEWLFSWQVYGVSFAWYIMGFAIIGLMMDYIFG